MLWWFFCIASISLTSMSAFQVKLSYWDLPVPALVALRAVIVCWEALLLVAASSNKPAWYICSCVSVSEFSFLSWISSWPRPDFVDKSWTGFRSWGKQCYSGKMFISVVSAVCKLSHRENRRVNLMICANLCWENITLKEQSKEFLSEMSGVWMT